MTAKKAPEEVVNAEDKQLRSYELMLIVSPEVMDESLDAIVDRISHFITEKGGTISNVEQWGKRRLAYPIGHFSEGNYVLTRFEFKPDLGRELEAKLLISEDILRHLLIRIE